MELPITIVFEPPSRAELRAVLRKRWPAWVLAGVLLTVAVGIFLAVTGASRAEAPATGALTSLDVRSRPAGADIWLDGRLAGRTPEVLAERPGRHRLRLVAPDAAEFDYNVDLDASPATFEASVWRRQPLVTRLRPPVPGAVLSSVHLARGGPIDLVLSVPPGRDLEAWRFEPASGAYTRVIGAVPAGRLSVASANALGAFVGREIGPPPPGVVARDQVLWLVSGSDSSTMPRALWRAPADETLLDLSWAPDGQRMLVTTAQQVGSDAARSWLWLIDANSGVARQLLTVPSEVVAGSIDWSPDSQRAALLAHAGALNALCLLELDGTLRYLADLELGAGAALPYPPLQWSADGQRALFAAPRQDPSPTGDFFSQPAVKRAIYLVDDSASAPRVVSDSDTPLAAWLEDGRLLTIGHTRDGLLEVDAVGLDQRPERLVELPLKPTGPYAAEWDVPNGRILLATRSSSSALEYWLIQLALADRS